MAYRDDEEARLARADALQRDLDEIEAEAKRLRHERDLLAEDNQALRAAAGEQSAARVELERLAARADLPVLVTEEPAPARRANKSPARAPSFRQQSRHYDDDRTPLGAVLAPLALGAILVPIFGLLPWMIPAGGGAALVGGIGHSMLRWRWRLGWIDRLPYDFDRKAYLEILSDEPTSINLGFRVDFIVPVAGGADRDQVAQAARGAWSGVDGTWEDDVLVLTAPWIACSRTFKRSNGERYKVHNPIPIHYHCKRMARDVLAKLHAAYPIHEVSVYHPRKRRDR